MLSSSAGPQDGRWIRRLDRLIGPRLRIDCDAALTRSRMTVGTSAIGALLLACVAAPSSLFFGQPDVAVVNVASGLLMLVTIPLLRATGSVEAAAIYLTGLGWLSMLGIFVSSSSTNLSAVYCLSVLPLAGMLLGGPRVGAVWLGITCASVYALTQMSLPALLHPTPALPAKISMAITRDIIMLTVWISLFAAFYDVLRGRAVRDAQRANERAEESERRFERAFAANPDAIAIWDIEHDRVIECNQGFLDAAGLDRSQVIGELSWTEALYIEPSKRETVLEGLAADSDRLELSVRTAPSPGEPGREPREFLVVATTIDVEGRPCVLASSRDMSERRELERHLRHAHKMEAVGQLAGSIAHDFNNMLTVISGYASQLMREIEGEQGEIIGEIHDAAERSAALTQQLLAFSRRQVIEPDVLEINAVLENVERLLDRLIGGSVRIAMDLSHHAIFVHADAGQLEQVIVNLAINARDAMPVGGTLTIRTESGQQLPHADEEGEPIPGAWARIRVEDTGEGMDEATLSRAAEPFFTTKGVGYGTGLGLATAHGIIGQSGGRLHLSSRPGKGTCVEIYLPELEEDGAPLAEEAPEPVAEADTAPVRPCRILLAEDEEMVRRLARVGLERAGHEVIPAANGAIALEIARGHEGEIDLVLTDVVMPELSGVALARQLGKEQPELPVVFMSGYPNPRTGDTNELPTDAWLIRKPFTPATLLSEIERFLRSLKS